MPPPQILSTDAQRIISSDAQEHIRNTGGRHMRPGLRSVPWRGRAVNINEGLVRNKQENKGTKHDVQPHRGLRGRNDAGPGCVHGGEVCTGSIALRSHPLALARGAVGGRRRDHLPPRPQCRRLPRPPVSHAAHIDMWGGQRGRGVGRLAKRPREVGDLTGGRHMRPGLRSVPWPARAATKDL